MSSFEWWAYLIVGLLAGAGVFLAYVNGFKAGKDDDKEYNFTFVCPKKDCGYRVRSNFLRTVQESEDRHYETLHHTES